MDISSRPFHHSVSGNIHRGSAVGSPVSVSGISRHLEDTFVMRKAPRDMGNPCRRRVAVAARTELLFHEDVNSGHVIADPIPTVYLQQFCHNHFSLPSLL